MAESNLRPKFEVYNALVSWLIRAQDVNSFMDLMDEM